MDDNDFVPYDARLDYQALPASTYNAMRPRLHEFLASRFPGHLEERLDGARYFIGDGRLGAEVLGEGRLGKSITVTVKLYGQQARAVEEELRERRFDRTGSTATIESLSAASSR